MHKFDPSPILVPPYSRGIIIWMNSNLLYPMMLSHKLSFSGQSVSEKKFLKDVIYILICKIWPLLWPNNHPLGHDFHNFESMLPEDVFT